MYAETRGTYNWILDKDTYFSVSLTSPTLPLSCGNFIVKTLHSFVHRCIALQPRTLYFRPHIEWKIFCLHFSTSTLDRHRIKRNRINCKSWWSYVIFVSRNFAHLSLSLAPQFWWLPQPINFLPQTLTTVFNPRGESHHSIGLNYHCGLNGRRGLHFGT